MRRLYRFSMRATQKAGVETRGHCGRFRKTVTDRRDGRVAEGARLESVYTARYPGFESLSLRHNSCETRQKRRVSRYKPPVSLGFPFFTNLASCSYEEGPLFPIGSGRKRQYLPR